jgi:hypothetical protein
MVNHMCYGKGPSDSELPSHSHAVAHAINSIDRRPPLASPTEVRFYKIRP